MFQERWNLDQKIRAGPDHYAPGEPVDSHCGSQHQCAEDDAKLVHGWRQGRDQEDLVRIENAGDQPAQPKQHGRNKLNTQEGNRQGKYSRIVCQPGRQRVPDHLRREQGREKGQTAQGQGDKARNGRSEPPGFGSILTGKQTGESRNKS